MEKNIRAIIDKTLIYIKLRGFVTAIRSLYQLEIVEGHFISSTLYQSIDKNGKPIPWFTYPFNNYLNSLDLKRKLIFEYGSGNSSIYWAKHCKKLTTVEHDKHWFEQALKKLSSYKNIDVVLASSKNDYINAILKYKENFDIVVVDGEWRKECTINVIKKLKPGGVLILDNSDWFPQIRKYLDSKGFFRIDFKGFAPQNPYMSTTSIFFKKYNFNCIY